MIISVHTDGSFSDPVGGFGYVITARHRGKNVIKKYISPKYVDTTNNRMEMKAIIKALESIDPGHKIDIYSDSQYCINSINLWMPMWLMKGKLREKANFELWLRFIEIKEFHLERKSTLNFTWTRGHNQNPLNELADQLANTARCQEKMPISCKDNN